MAKLNETVTFRLSEDEKKMWVEWCELQRRSQNDEFRIYLDSIRQKIAKKRKEMKN